MDLRRTTSSRSKLLATSVVAAGLCCLSLIASPAVASDWSAPWQISGGERVSGPLMSFHPDGSSTLAWNRESGSVRVADRQAGSEFELSDEIDGGPGWFLRTAGIATNRNGATALAMIAMNGGSQGIRVAVRPPGGIFGTPASITTSGPPEDLSVAIAPDGTLVVTWFVSPDIDLNLNPENGGSGLFVWVKEAGEDSGTVTGLSADAVYTDFERILGSDVMVMGDDGTATVAWRTLGVDDTTVYLTRTRPPGGDFGPPEELATGADVYTTIKLRVDADGVTSAYWDCDGICWADREPGGPWDPIQTLATTGGVSGFDVDARPDGTTVAAWSSRNGSTARIVAARRQPGGSFGTPQVISGDSESAVLPLAAISPDGKSTVIWRDNDYPDSLRGASSDEDGVFSPATTIATPPTLYYGYWLASGPGGASAYWLSGEANSRSIAISDRTSGGFSEPSTVADLPGHARDPKVGFLTSNALTVWQQGSTGLTTIEQSSHQTGDFVFSDGFALKTRSTDPELDTDSLTLKGSAVWVRHEPGSSIVQAATSANEYLTRGFDVSDRLPGNPQPEVAVGPQSVSTAAWIGQNLNTRGIAAMHPTIQTADFTGAGPIPGKKYVSELGEQVGDPDVASAHTNATTAIVWTGGPDGNAIRVAIRRPGDDYYSSTAVAVRGLNKEPQIAVGEQGQVIVAWVRSGNPSRIMMAISRGGHEFGPAMAVPGQGSSGASGPDLGVTSTGRYWITWRGGDGKVRAASGTDQPGKARTISGSSTAASAPALSVSPRAFAAVAWRSAKGSIWAATSSESGIIGPPVEVASGAAADAQPEIATGYSGISQLVWVDADGPVKAVQNYGALEDCKALSMFRFKGIGNRNRKKPYRIRIHTSSPGSLTVTSSKNLKKKVRRSNGRSVSVLPLHLRRAATRKLRRKGKLRVAVKIRFQTDGYCAPVSRNFKVKLKRR